MRHEFIAFRFLRRVMLCGTYSFIKKERATPIGITLPTKPHEALRSVSTGALSSPLVKAVKAYASSIRLSMYNFRAETVQFCRRMCSTSPPRGVQRSRRIQFPLLWHIRSSLTSLTSIITVRKAKVTLYSFARVLSMLYKNRSDAIWSEVYVQQMLYIMRKYSLNHVRLFRNLLNTPWRNTRDGVVLWVTSKDDPAKDQASK